MRRQELHPRTAVINKRQKIKSKKARNEALSWLAGMFPELFDNSLRIRPLKIGIMNDILAFSEQAQKAGISKSKLREAVVLFTRRIDYLTCLKAREMRVDLQGNPVSAVTEEEAERAASKIKKRVEKSARNARKNLIAKMPYSNARPTNPYNFQIQESTPSYSDRNYTPGTPIQSSRPASVIVKHKSPRQFDPDAVARLKEKLGLSRKAEEEKT